MTLAILKSVVLLLITHACWSNCGVADAEFTTTVLDTEEGEKRAVEVEKNGIVIFKSNSLITNASEAQDKDGRVSFSNSTGDDVLESYQIETIDESSKAIKNGFDVVIKLRNSGAEDRLRPQVMLNHLKINPSSELPEKIRYINTTQLGKIANHRLANPSGIHSNRPYPAVSYSPTVGFACDEYSVGASLKYDVIKENHWVGCRYAYFTGKPTIGMGFDLSESLPRKIGSSRQPEDPNRFLAPGQSETLRMMVRFSNSEGILQNLQVYKEYLDSKFGVGVNYLADLRPVAGIAIATNQGLKTNKRGYVFSAERLETRISSEIHGGYRRFMFWAPSGLYRKNPVNNYPPQFMTEWEASSPLAKNYNYLLSQNVDIGMWWGRSSQMPVPRVWDAPKMEIRNVCIGDDDGAVSENDPQIKFAFDELDQATAWKVDTVGLDAFSKSDIRVRRCMLKDMHAKYPKIRFVTEPSDCDVIHKLAPTLEYFSSQRTNIPVLADFLNPGHESWILFRRADEADLDIVAANFDAIIANGLVPVGLDMQNTFQHNPLNFADGTGRPTLRLSMNNDSLTRNGLPQDESGYGNRIELDGSFESDPDGVEREAGKFSGTEEIRVMPPSEGSSVVRV